MKPFERLEWCPAQGPTGCPAAVPVMLQRGGEGRAHSISPAARDCGDRPVRPGDRRYREVFDLQDCKGGLARPGDRREALRALSRERSTGGCAGGGGGVI